MKAFFCSLHFKVNYRTWIKSLGWQRRRRFSYWSGKFKVETKSEKYFGLTTNMKLFFILPLILHAVNFGAAADKKFACPLMVGSSSKHVLEVEKVRKRSNFNRLVMQWHVMQFSHYQSFWVYGMELNFTRTSTARMKHFLTLACDWESVKWKMWVQLIMFIRFLLSVFHFSINRFMPNLRRSPIRTIICCHSEL